ncbi:tellurium resistance protein TerC, partial [Shigella flexneri]|nr:tellurium resistance protein TerC [Shigella flexneri]
MVSTHIGFPTETVIVFIALSVGAIFIDLFMHRDDKPISLKSAALWSVFWVVVAMAFAGFLLIHHGAEAASLFVTGHALAKVLSVDNLLVMLAIFSWFAVPDRYRLRFLYLGLFCVTVFSDILLPICT